MILVIDDVLPEEQIADLYEIALRELMYSYVPQTSGDYETYNTYLGNVYTDSRVADYGQLVCQIADYRIAPRHSGYFSEFSNLNRALIDKFNLKLTDTIRMKINILLKQENALSNHYNIPHQDSDRNDWTVVYYLNDSDGDTYFFNEYYSKEMPKNLTVYQQVSPKRNRAVLFESNRYHASSNPITSKNRFVINWIFKNEY